MPEIIDAASHIISEPILEEIEKLHDTNQAASLRNAPRLTAVDERIDFLDRHGIDKQAINIIRPPIWKGLEPSAAVEATRVANNEIRRIADQHPDRLIPMGTLPFLTGEYLDEAKRCVEDLNFGAIQIFSNINDQFLDEEKFDSFWATINDLDIPIWIHPQIYNWHAYDTELTWIYKMLGWPFETAVCVARLIFSGMMDRHKNVEIVTHHLGGVLPYLVGRFRSWYQTRQEEPEMYEDQRVADLDEPLDAYIDRVYGDTATSSHGESYPLECGYEFFGADNMVYSSDYPLGPDRGEFWPKKIIAAIDEMDIPAGEKEQIYSGNAKRLLGL